MHVQKAIERLGFRPNEARVYLAALGLGESTISEIALKAQIPRTSAQAIVEKLHAEGLMNFYIKKRYHYWVAERPEKLLEKVHAGEESIRAVMPELDALRHAAGEKPAVKIFIGVDDLKLIHEDILAAKHPILAIIAWEEWSKTLGDGYISEFIERRASHHLKMRLLSTKNAKTAKLRDSDGKELRATRFMPDETPIDSAIFIYADKVAIISLNDRFPMGVLIQDAKIRCTMEVFFEGLWTQSAAEPER